MLTVRNNFAHNTRQAEIHHFLLCGRAHVQSGYVGHIFTSRCSRAVCGRRTVVAELTRARACAGDACRVVPSGTDGFYIVILLSAIAGN